MRYLHITAISLHRTINTAFVAIAAVAIFPVFAKSQSAPRVAVIDPKPAIADFAQSLEKNLTSRFRVIDRDTAGVAFLAAGVENAFNLSISEGKSLADSIGCNYLVIVRTGLQPRQNVGRLPYVEAYAALFLIEGRSGRLRKFLLYNVESSEIEKARNALIARASEIAAAVSDTFLHHQTSAGPTFPYLSLSDSPEATNLRQPAPYRRVKPDYPLTAFLYSVQASVEIEADIDADGRVGNTAIVRWAGFGLEEAVERAVRTMNWRPAYRDGKPLAARVLLRYNFRKPASNEEP